MSDALPPPVATGNFPVGTILASAATLNQAQLETEGWMYCNGAAISRSTYADLFGVIGTAFGAGDGVSTFDIPDCRGYFARGADNGADVDPDAASRTSPAPGGNTGKIVGSVQGYATHPPVTTVFSAQSAGAHTHTVNHVPTDNSSYAMAGSYQAIWNGGSANTNSAGAHSHNVSGGDAETVPLNGSVYFTIKFQDVP